MTQCLPAGIFTLAGAYQMTVWALGKHRNYRNEFKVIILTSLRLNFAYAMIMITSYCPMYVKLNVFWQYYIL